MGLGGRFRMPAYRITRRVLDEQRRLCTAADDELLSLAVDLRWQDHRRAMAPECVILSFALVVESIRRQCGINLFPVQIMAGYQLLGRNIVEMQTGEGKTLSALLPAFVRSLTGVGCHVLTSNDYLARRDAELANRVLSPLGQRVGVVDQASDKEDRRAAYACDVTYGTVREFGFDYLRDQLQLGPLRGWWNGSERRASVGCVQRGLHSVIVDEADSLLIDDAGTPMIISCEEAGQQQTEVLRWAGNLADEMVETRDFLINSNRRQISLTGVGRRTVLLRQTPRESEGLTTADLIEHVKQAVIARAVFCRDREYVVHEGRIQIVDEATGRIQPGRKWQDGLQESIEFKEGVPLTCPSAQVASMSVQRFLNQYQDLSGMTGTASAAATEFQKVFDLSVHVIPTHRPRIVRNLPPLVFLNLQSKWAWIAEQVELLHRQGRPVLIGTPSIHASEQLHGVLAECGVDCELLHARAHERESAIIRHAGEPGRVTIATNMAGRGTDITVLPEVIAAGGLHVIATELHGSARIDRQLAGRTGRQGAPGTFQQLASLEDSMLDVLTEQERSTLQRRVKLGGSQRQPTNRIGPFLQLQKQIERTARRRRIELMKHERQHARRCHRIGLEPVLEFL